MKRDWQVGDHAYIDKKYPWKIIGQTEYKFNIICLPTGRKQTINKSALINSRYISYMPEEEIFLRNIEQ